MLVTDLRGRAHRWAHRAAEAGVPRALQTPCLLPPGGLLRGGGGLVRVRATTNTRQLTTSLNWPTAKSKTAVGSPQRIWVVLHY